MKKNTKIALTATGVAAATAAVAGAVVAFGKFFGAVAINRKGVKLPMSMRNRMTGGMMEDPAIPDILKASDDARALPTETVTIQSSDGLTLTGHYYPCKDPKRIIIAMHGWRSSWPVDYGMSSRFFHDCGCAVLYPDQRGTNNSDGEYIGFGVLERRDCLDWISYVINRFGTDLPIYLVGVSMGASTVLMTLGYELPDCVRGCIADCGFTSPHAIWTHVMNENLGLSEKLAYPIINRICNKKAQFDGDEYSTVEALKENTVPVLFIHGGADKFVPIQMTFENYEACTAEKDLLVVPGAGHGMSYASDTEAYKNAVRKFFKKHDI